MCINHKNTKRNVLFLHNLGQRTWQDATGQRRDEYNKLVKELFCCNIRKGSHVISTHQEELLDRRRCNHLA